MLKTTIKKTAGYTLIEMLLVITLIALIVSLGILAYRNNADNNRINKAALETQNVLAAAMTYRTNQGDWPTSHDDSDCTTAAPDDADTFITHYLPNQSAETTYGGYYCWGVNDSSSLFWVALEVPNDDANLAKRIAAQLPNAVDTTTPADAEQDACPDDNSSPCYVRTEVAQISTGNSTDGATLAGMGYCDPSDGGTAVSGSTDSVTCQQNTAKRDQYFVTFDCASGETGSVYIVPNFYSNPGGDKTVTANLTRLSAAGASVDSCTSATVGNQVQWTCTVNLIAKYDGSNNVVNANHLSNGTIGATYTAFCKAATTQHRATTHYY